MHEVFSRAAQSLMYVVALLVLSWPSKGQVDATVTGAGYLGPVPLVVAPGQILTVFVAGVKTRLDVPLHASTVPLPTTLGGISASLEQTASPHGPVSVPLLSVFPVRTCSEAVAGDRCQLLVGVSLQIPFELKPFIGGPLEAPNPARLLLSEAGMPPTAVELRPTTDQVHILREDDSLLRPGADTANRERPPIVIHSDGEPVSAGNPGRPGETLTLFAVGLGPTTPMVGSGEASPIPAANVNIGIRFDFRPDAGPSRPTAGPVGVAGPGGTAQLSFAGLAPGWVGLYQVNFSVPDLPERLERCGVEANQSNLTVSIGVLRSFDGAGICVAPR